MFGDLLEKTPTTNLKDVASYFIGLTYKPTDVSETGTVVLRSSNIQNNILDFNDIKLPPIFSKGIEYSNKCTYV